MSDNLEYCGHISIYDGKITIDLGGRILADGVYSIIQESITRRPAKKEKKELHNAYDKDLFIKTVMELIDGRQITMKQACKELGMHDGTFYGRIKALNLYHLFKLRKPASEYAQPNGR